MSHRVRHAVVLGLLLAGGGCSPTPYRLPPGATGVLPSSAGHPCKPGWFSGDVIELTNDIGGTGFRVKQTGSASVRCPERKLAIVVEDVARLEITGPDRVVVGDLLEPEYRLEAYGVSGEELDLGFASGPAITWTSPDSFTLRQPRCGHMMAVCSGFVGRGEIMRASPRAPGSVVLEATMNGKTVSRTITVVARDERAPEPTP